MIVDGIIVVLVIAAAFRGLRRGAAIQLLTIVGFLVGLAIGALLVVVVAPHVAGQVAKTIVSLAALLVPASFFAGIGARVGGQAARVVRRLRFGTVDAVIGATISVAGTLVVCWLFASILVNTTYSSIARQIESSRIVRAVQGVMPPIPNTFATVERYLSTDGFPQVLVNILPESTGPVTVPNNEQLRAAASLAGPATVKIVALGCGDQQEGSGFVAATTSFGDLVVTNAHVVAGTNAITVHAQNGLSATGVVVLFDPKFDIAIMKVPPLGITPLNIDPSFIDRGVPAVELGYPEGGPFTADKAGIIARFAAEGRDIYDRSLTVRTVYELQALVRPGNSGGPLVASSGEVEGVVFSRSATQDDIGFALASPGVLRRLEQAETSNGLPVSTQSCTG